MPQLIFLIIVAGAVWLFFHKFVGDAQKLSQRTERQRKEAQNQAQGTLVQDPETGEYRVKRDDE